MLRPPFFNLTRTKKKQTQKQTRKLKSKTNLEARAHYQLFAAAVPQRAQFKTQNLPPALRRFFNAKCRSRQPRRKVIKPPLIKPPLCLCLCAFRRKMRCTYPSLLRMETLFCKYKLTAYPLRNFSVSFYIWRRASAVGRPPKMPATTPHNRTIPPAKRERKKYIPHPSSRRIQLRVETPKRSSAIERPH